MKKFKITLVFISAILLGSCSQDTLETEINESANLTNSTEQELLSIDQINAIIDGYLQRTGDFNWNKVSDQVVWSAAIHGNNILTIGYGNEGESFRTTENQRLTATKNSIVDEVMDIEGTLKGNTLIEDNTILNVIDVEIKSIETITALRLRGDIRYLEPNGYSFFTTTNFYPQNRSTSGCNQDGQTLDSNDYRTVAPNSLVSWTFDHHNIEQAWAHSTGANVTVGLIDTGVSANQPFLGTNFNDGYSSGRTIEKYGTFIDSPWWWSSNYDGPDDKCGHGTTMASTIASPRNDNFMPVGVAYNANLVSYRATEDVVLNDYHERKGVTDALVALADRSDVKIISMSVGYAWSIGNIEDAIRYAYANKKLIFAAGGTSLDFTNWYPVIFPASMSETVAVTGITDSGNYDQCDSCHDGSEIEFTVVMERDNDNSRTGTTLGFYNGDKTYVGGSSVATATVAGIAALVWSKHPNWNRFRVLKKLKKSSEFWRNKDDNKGYGNIDALKAVQ